MAINVNTVYQTVLLILNKEQRGYMTPVEFNKIGTQVQLEIFEKYFEDLNQQIRIPQTDTDYADRVLNLDEKIAIFKTTGSSAYNAVANPFFSLPTNAATATTTTIASTGATSYIIPNTTSNQSIANPVVIVNGVTITTGFSFTNNVLTFTANTPPASLINIPVVSPSGGNAPNEFSVAQNVANRGIQVNSVITGATTIGNALVAVVDTNPAVGVFIFPNNTQNYAAGALLNFTNNIVVSGIWSDSSQSSVYRLGGVNYTNGAISTQELERVTRSELYHLLGSNLTKPTVTYPIYIYEDQKLFVYPTSITSGITCDFVKKPVNPSWNFTSTASSNYAYIYDSTTSINFELHQSEQTEMILKVLLYAGVVIKDPQIIQAAAAQIQAETINQKS